MFSTFPDGSPGAGLLLLRAAAGAGLIAQAITRLGASRDSEQLALAFAMLATLTGILLLLGLLTRLAGIVAVVVSLGEALSWLPSSPVESFETRTTSVLLLTIAAALVCLGAGAFSIDAHVFGHREVVIPKSRHDSEA